MACSPQVDVYTAHHDPARCFAETVDGPFSVTVFGDWFPRHVFGKLHALCAYIRCLIVAINIAWLSYRRVELGSTGRPPPCPPLRSLPAALAWKHAPHSITREVIGSGPSSSMNLAGAACSMT